MYAVPGSKGVGTAVLAHLEAIAASFGYRQVCLETRIVNETAMRFYEKHGYCRIENYGKYVDRPEAACFAKELDQ